jgi:hypothetical protein
MSKYHLEEPLFRSSCDTISWILQSINEGAEVTLKAAFAAAIFQRLARRVYVEQEKEPLQILLNTTVDLDKKLVWIAETKTEVVNEGQLCRSDYAHYANGYASILIAPCSSPMQLRAQHRIRIATSRHPMDLMISAASTWLVSALWGLRCSTCTTSWVWAPLTTHPTSSRCATWLWV